MGLYDGMGFFEKIAFTIALPVLVPAAIVKEVYDKVTDAEETSDNYERNLRQENERAEREARERAERDREARAREQAELTLISAKNLAISFLNEHYRNHAKRSAFVSIIQQQDTPYWVKQKFADIVDKNPCDEIKTMTDNREKQKARISQLDIALSDLNKLTGSL